jgi:Uma2 family endonuclease
MVGDGWRRYTPVTMAPMENGVWFPEEERVPETKRHLEVRTALYQALKLAFEASAAIGSDQFLYWDPTDAHQCLAPDVFVRLGVPDYPFRIWKVWEHGAPQVAVEVISSSDERDRDWDAKLARYRKSGILELVRFDPETPESSLRIWDAVDGTLVERVGESRAKCRWLPGFWLVVDDPLLGLPLRLSRDPEGREVYLTPAEHEATGRAAERVAAEQRIRELEAELRRRDHG